MEKPIRNAVRCYVIKENKVVVIKYKKGSKKEGYYDIPGGKIEEGENPKQTAIREMKEETGMSIKDLRHKGNMIIEYPDRKYVFDVLITNEFEGEPQEFKDNTAQWIEIDKLLKEDKLLSCIMILNRFFIKGLLDDNKEFDMYSVVDEQENVLDINYTIKSREKNYD